MKIIMQVKCKNLVQELTIYVRSSLSMSVVNLYIDPWNLVADLTVIFKFVKNKNIYNQLYVHIIHAYFKIFFLYFYPRFIQVTYISWNMPIWHYFNPNILALSRVLFFAKRDLE